MVHSVAKSWTQLQQLSTHARKYIMTDVNDAEPVLSTGLHQPPSLQQKSPQGQKPPKIRAKVALAWQKVLLVSGQSFEPLLWTASL